MPSETTGPVGVGLAEEVVVEEATELLALLGVLDAAVLDGAEEARVDEAGEVDWAAEGLLGAALDAELGVELATELEEAGLRVPAGSPEPGGIASLDGAADVGAADVGAADDETADVGTVDVAPLATHLYSSRRLPAPQYSVLSPGQRKLQSAWLAARVDPPTRELPQ